MLTKTEIEEYVRPHEKHYPRKEEHHWVEPDEEILELSYCGVDVVDYLYVVTPHYGIVMRVITENDKRDRRKRRKHDIRYDEYRGRFTIANRSLSVLHKVATRVNDRFDDRRDMLDAVKW